MPTASRTDRRGAIPAFCGTLPSARTVLGAVDPRQHLDEPLLGLADAFGGGPLGRRGPLPDTLRALDVGDGSRTGTRS